MPKTNNQDSAQTETEAELPTTRYVRDSAVGARPADRDRVLVRGCREPQRRPGGGYMDY